MINRIWVVVNRTTSDILYSSSSWSKAKAAFDSVLRAFSPAGASCPFYDISLDRYDLNSSYRGDK